MSANISGNFIIFKKNDSLIISGKKLGNRFIHQTRIFETESDLKNGLQKCKKAYWIIRDPREHFISALVTELNHLYKNFDNPYEVSKKIKTKSNDTKWIVECMKKIIDNKLYEKEIGVEHFSSHFEFGLYEKIYEKLITEYKTYYKIIFIELNDLSNLINGVFESEYAYKEKTYNLDFKTENLNINKETVKKLLDENFVEQMDEIQKKLVNEYEFYQKVKNFDFPAFLIDKLESVYLKIQDQYNERLIDVVDIVVDKIEKMSKLLKNKIP